MGKGKPEQTLEQVDTFDAQERGENTSDTNMFCAMNSWRTQRPHVIPCNVRTSWITTINTFKKEEHILATVLEDKDKVNEHCMYCRQGRGIS